MQPSRPAHLAWSFVGIADSTCGLTRPVTSFGRDGPILGKRTPETQQAGLLTGRCHKTPRLLTPLVSCMKLGPLTPVWPSSGVAFPPCELTRPARAPGRDDPNASKRTPGTQQADPLTGRCYTTPRLLRPLVSCRNCGGPLWETRGPNVGIAAPLVGTAAPPCGIWGSLKICQRGSHPGAHPN